MQRKLCILSRPAHRVYFRFMQDSRRFPLTFACAICVAGALCQPAGAAVTIGPTEEPISAETQVLQFPDDSLIFNVHSPPETPVIAPVSGVITRWRFWTGQVTGGPTLQLRAIRLEGGNQLRVTRSADPQIVPDVPSGAEHRITRHEFPARLRILAGETIGAGISRPVPGQVLTVNLPVKPATSPWAYAFDDPPQPADGETSTAVIIDQPSDSMSSDQFVQMNADIEPDADGDGYGDETQDLCPADATTQGVCPQRPDTADPSASLSGVPGSLSLKKFLKGINARITADEPVALSGELLATARTARISSFNLRLATKSAGLAAGPRTLKLKPSRRLVGHPRKRFRVRLRIVATDAAGNATIVTKTVRVRPRR
jgi:hypothetical protein